jgi:hypothetical protein
MPAPGPFVADVEGFRRKPRETQRIRPGAAAVYPRRPFASPGNRTPPSRGTLDELLASGALEDATVPGGHGEPSGMIVVSAAPTSSAAVR